MGNIIIILIIIALMFIAARRIYRTIRFGGSCCSTGTGIDKKVRVKDRNKANYPFSYRLKIDGMVCAGCVRKVENIINSTGDLWANADLGNKEVYVLAKRTMTREDFVHLFNGTSYTVLEIL